MNGNTSKISVYLMFLTIIGALMGVFYLFTASNAFDKRVEYEKELKRPPFFDITYIKDSDCEDCFEIELFGKFLQEEGAETNETTLEYDEKEGEGFIKEYELDKVPALVMQGDLKKNNDLYEMLLQLGRVEDNNYYILEDLRPIYIDLNTNEKVGMFKTTFIIADDCADCYDTTLHTNALEQLGMKTTDVEMLDYKTQKGKELIEKYEIKGVPTVIISGDLDQYSQLDSVWGDVGTKEEDGAYIFRDLGYLGTYKNLETNEIVQGQITN